MGMSDGPPPCPVRDTLLASRLRFLSSLRSALSASLWAAPGLDCLGLKSTGVLHPEFVVRMVPVFLPSCKLLSRFGSAVSSALLALLLFLTFFGSSAVSDFGDSSMCFRTLGFATSSSGFSTAGSCRGCINIILGVAECWLFSSACFCILSPTRRPPLTKRRDPQRFSAYKALLKSALDFWSASISVWPLPFKRPSTSWKMSSPVHWSSRVFAPSFAPRPRFPSLIATRMCVPLALLYELACGAYLAPRKFPGLQPWDSSIFWP